MKDPGFLAGLIGWAIGFAMNGMLHRIKIVYCFREKLEDFQSLHQSISFSTIGKEKRLERHFERASDIVKNGSKVPWFNVIKRYQMSKTISELTLKIENEGNLLRFESVVTKLSHESTLISPLQPLPPPKCEPPPPPPPPKSEPPLPPLALASPPPEFTPPLPPPPEFTPPPPEFTPPLPPLVLGPPSPPPQPPPAFSAPLPPPVLRPPSSPPAILPLPPTDEETPSQALPAEEETTSQGLLKHLTINPIMEIVKKISRRRDDSAYLKHLLRIINPTMEMVKRIYRRRDGSAYLKHLLRTISPTMEMVKTISRRRDDSALGWCERLQKLLEEAKDLILQIDRTYNFDIFRRYRNGKRIQRLTSRISEHLRLFPLLETMPASSNDPRESNFHLFSNNPRGSEG